MRFAAPLSCGLTAGLFISLSLDPATSSTPSAEPLAMQDRTFAGRFAGVRQPAPERALGPPGPFATDDGPSHPFFDEAPVLADGRAPGIMFTALEPAKGASLDDLGARLWGGPGALPAVPRLLTGPAPAAGPARAAAPPTDVPLLRLERPLPELLPPNARVCAVCAATRMSAAHEPHPMSRLPGGKQVSSHAGDPLAALEPEEESIAAAKPAPEFLMPFANGRVTSLFNQGRRHPAIDLGGALGSPVMATTAGQKVTFAGWRGGYGKAVITIDPQGRTHLYGHLKSIALRPGQLLAQGELLGHLGSTGRSTGPHVHYEVRDHAGRHIDPVTLLFPGRRVSNGYAWRGVDPDPAVRPALVAIRTGSELLPPR
jgi:hypothetical protein